MKKEPQPIVKLDEDDLRKLAVQILNISHVTIQCDDAHEVDQLCVLISEVEKLPKNYAIRFLIHIIHVQQLQLANAEIKYDETNPFKEMVKFQHIISYLKSFPTEEDNETVMEEPKKNFNGLLPCPFCGSNSLLLFAQPSKDKSLTWNRIMHDSSVPCGISMIHEDVEQLKKDWNNRQTKP